MTKYNNYINNFDPRNESVPLGQKFPNVYTKFPYLYKDLNYYYYLNPSQNIPFFSPIFPQNTKPIEIKKITPMFENKNYFYIDNIKDYNKSPLEFLNETNYFRTDIISNQMNFINKNKQFIFKK